ncbi:response regulator transcription factor [Paenibacillus athensensis]|uniref:DNA-binding response regulator n=1 Tax=Paenibacillus athensensis TaxID=1967502 RepID=A0A4Y8Q2G0_9BACL|nr:response regulator transcription factor [Paenibacillus athensensis]MCD1258699.1 response regulator transcription factor [Paenibacillus athensensis]
MERILLIEDEERIARVLQLELEHEGYEVQRAADGREGLRAALDTGETWSLILLDIMLPGLNGLEVLRRIRQTDAAVPVMLLTARGSVPDRVSGLDQGANDYVSKPFAIEELLARVRSLLRQRQAQADERTGEVSAVLAAGDLTMDTKSRAVRRGDAQIELTPTEFELLRFLLERREEVVTREQIMNEVWGYDYVGDTNVVDVYIRYVRQKIDKPFPTKLIHTLRGVGYMLKDGAEAAEERGADDDPARSPGVEAAEERPAETTAPL